MFGITTSVDHRGAKNKHKGYKKRIEVNSETRYFNSYLGGLFFCYV